MARNPWKEAARGCLRMARAEEREGHTADALTWRRRAADALVKADECARADNLDGRAWRRFQAARKGRHARRRLLLA